MGIQGLTKFVSPKMGSFSWNSLTGLTNIIVDGKSFLYHFLYRLDWRNGGDNVTFTRRLHGFLNRVPKHVKFYVLIDGGDQEYKSETMKKRRAARRAAINAGFDELENNIHGKCPTKSIRTAMIMDIFIQSLNKRNHIIHIINGEADFALQSYAREYDGYVFSDDSDALLIECRGIIRFNGPQLQIIYHKDVMDSLNLKTEEELRTFASLLGNDITKNEPVHLISKYVKENSKQQQHYFLQLSEFVKSCNGDITKNLKMLDCIKNKKAFLDGNEIYGRSCKRIINTAIEYAEKGLCSDMLMQAITFGKLYCSILPEVESLPSAWIRTRTLRKLIYGIFNVDHVLEIYTNESKFDGQDGEECDEYEQEEYAYLIRNELIKDVESDNTNFSTSGTIFSLKPA